MSTFRQQATSKKQKATSNRQQATGNRQQTTQMTEIYYLRIRSAIGVKLDYSAQTKFCL
ncbi:hypothetical protein [Dapis sp. BLCC M229]|uniref:hypothetical protein n=1 Tax=Dapis sp. BLCC M229 TaxID=3400188 RepID=UPI003CF52710